METVVEQLDQIVEWLRDKVNSAKAKGLVVGVSGGVDSAVVAALIKKAFPDNSLGLILPCHSNPQDGADALDVVMALGLKHTRIEITEAHNKLLMKVEESMGKLGLHPPNLKLANANLRARLRMATLYTVANANNYLVAGTDNAPETYTGYFTKYGDGGVDILPLSQFLKREVRAFAVALGVPNHIITKAPSAGLWAGQTDEEEMGITYEEIDDYLEGKEISESAKARLDHLHACTGHKRELPPAYERTDK